MLFYGLMRLACRDRLRGGSEIFPQQVDRRPLIPTPGENNANGTKKLGRSTNIQQAAAKQTRYYEAYNENDAGHGGDAAGERI
jgi:hypothetical protein